MASNRRWRCQFRCRGSRRESAVAQLFSLGVIATRMSYAPLLTRRSLAQWEIVVSQTARAFSAIRYKQAAGNNELDRLLASFQDFCDTLLQLARFGLSDIGISPAALPMHGVAGGGMIDHSSCVQIIPVERSLVTYMLRLSMAANRGFTIGRVKRTLGCVTILKSVAALAVEAELYQPWLDDTEYVLSAIVPEAHGLTTSGIY